MREILFRGKRIDTEEWVVGRNILITKTGWCYICETGTSILVHCDDYSENPQMIQALPYRIDENTCGQFSNIVDSKENKIFEDDIIKINFAISPMYGVVVFVNGGFYIKTAELGLLDLCAIGHSRKIEVVGNIYDNPELIEVNTNDKL